ncbi:extracellular solute-binding protein [Paenibacillus sp. GXUN7292]|uniref:extracellular solute-binding protein n=1 Tax=Paenibacillus sp. GXUN7292 TaxID=3422499 RepID=UPI003D7ED1ED
MNNMFRLLVIVLIFAVAVGCSGGNKGGNSTEAPTNKPEETNAGKQSAAPQEPVVIEMASLYPNLDANNPVMTELSKKSGFEFDLVTVTGDRNQKFDLWLASGDYPADTVILKPDYIAKYADAGAIIPLEDLIEEHGPNIKKHFGEYFDLLKDENGHIWSLYVSNITDEPAPTLQSEFSVSYKVLAEAGYPELKTLDDLFNLLKNYYEKHPQTNGQPTIPFSGFSYNEGVNENVIGPIFSSSGLEHQGNFTIDENDNVKLIFMSDEAKQYLAFLNKLHIAGMLDKEFFTLKNDTMTQRLTEGRVLAGSFPGWYMQPEVEPVIRAAGNFDDLYAYFPLVFDTNKPNKNFTAAATRSNWNWAITAKSKHPEDVIKMLDYMFTDEAQILINWGIEGQHYEVVNGKRTIKEEYKQGVAANPDLIWSEIVTPFYGTSMYFAHGTKLADGDYATPTTRQSVREKYDERTKEVLSEYGKEVWADFVPEVNFILHGLGQLGDVEEVRAEVARLKQIWDRDTAKIVFSSSQEEFEKLWNNTVTALEKAGASKVEEAYTKLWKEATERYSHIKK